MSAYSLKVEHTPDKRSDVGSSPAKRIMPIFILIGSNIVSIMFVVYRLLKCNVVVVEPGNIEHLVELVMGVLSLVPLCYLLGGLHVYIAVLLISASSFMSFCLWLSRNPEDDTVVTTWIFTIRKVVWSRDELFMRLDFLAQKKGVVLSPQERVELVDASCNVSTLQTKLEELVVQKAQKASTVDLVTIVEKIWTTAYEIFADPRYWAVLGIGILLFTLYTKISVISDIQRRLGETAKTEEVTAAVQGLGRKLEFSVSQMEHKFQVIRGCTIMTFSNLSRALFDGYKINIEASTWEWLKALIHPQMLGYRDPENVGYHTIKRPRIRPGAVHIVGGVIAEKTKVPEEMLKVIREARLKYFKEKEGW